MSRVRTVVATEILLLLGLGGTVGVAFLIERVVGLSDPIALAPLPAICLGAFPALLWLSYFYSQDRHEPEPKHFVFGVYLLGAFIAGPLVHFLLAQVSPADTALRPMFEPFAVQSWSLRSPS